MQIAIIGSGNVGGALARALERAGHKVTFGSRSPEPGKPGEATVADAAGWADATILAVPFVAIAHVVAGAGGFAGKVLIDATNPVGMGDGGLGLTTGFDSSGPGAAGARLQDLQPDRVREHGRRPALRGPACHVRGR